MIIKFLIYFSIIVIFASIVTTMKVLYEVIKAADTDTCKEMLDSIAKRVHHIINKQENK
jgi:hypothetical protein